jgi:hypothetical protein
LLQGVAARPVRWKPWRSSEPHLGKRIRREAAKLLLVYRQPERLEAKAQLLLAAGIRLEAEAYETMRRGLMLIGVLAGCAGAAGVQRMVHLPVEPVYVLTASAVCLLLLATDRKLLEQLKLRRGHQIVKEIYVISNQLLYFNGSRMNLHHKLMRCVQPTRTIRKELQRMLAEWYQDAERAVHDFGRRIGTDEARSFAETLQALRLHEHESYYALLRERIQDYKEKLELARDSRKETVSYALFVLAGLPILNTFRVFMYPWVMEGQKLFQSLN